MRRELLLISTGLALASCAAKTPEPEQQCEDFIKRKITTPATFKRANPNEHGFPMKEGAEFWVKIEYDAQNQYGALIRDSYICQFPATKGAPDLTNYVDFDAAYETMADNMEEQADNLLSMDP